MSNQTEALKLALEALETDDWMKKMAASKAIRAALEDHDDTDPHAPWLAEAHLLCTDHGVEHGHITDRIRKLREVLAEQRLREPCYCDKTGIGEPGVSCGDCPTRDYKQSAQQQEPVVEDLAMMVRRLVLSIRRLAEDDSKDLTFANTCLDWLKRKGLAGSPLRDTHPAPEAKQEPFAEVRLNKTGGNAGLSTHIVQLAEGYYPAGTKLYTTPQPAKRKPLTDAEILAKANEIPQFIWTEGCSYETGVLQEEAIAFARAIEAKLKEKNTRASATLVGSTLHNLRAAS